MVSSKQAKGGKEIPIPDVRMVASYSVEYLPLHKEPRVYIRGKGDPLCLMIVVVTAEINNRAMMSKCT